MSRHGLARHFDHAAPNMPSDVMLLFIVVTYLFLVCVAIFSIMTVTILPVMPSGVYIPKSARQRLIIILQLPDTLRSS